jgi:uncharacterized protein DUF5615
LSLIRLYLDEDAGQHGLLAALRLRGVDVTRAQDENLIGASDERQLQWCVQNGRVLYTFNVRHFYALHADWTNTGREHAGMILALQQQYSIGEQMRRILRLIHAKSAEDLRCRVEFLNSW